MPVTIDQVLTRLKRDEPNYAKAAQLGPEAIPHLIRLVREGDRGIASKATYLAAFINAEQSSEVLDLAARRPEPVVRVAAAASLGNLKVIPVTTTTSLLNDQDSGVRILALKSLQMRRPPGFKTKVQEMAKDDPDLSLREVANQVLGQLP